ncbi:MAG: hypothetical protein EOO95_08435 [Pedobacter sp.]|nr:MAG: hypothetical protein EOO95_08435 [Pedobacter sp.]
MATNTELETTESKSSGTHKMLTWALAAVSSLASFFAIQNNNRLQESREIRESDKTYYQKQIEIRDITIEKKDRFIDSLNGLMLHRTDRELDQIRKWISIDTTKKSTVIIKKAKR